MQKQTFAKFEGVEFVAGKHSDNRHKQLVGTVIVIGVVVFVFVPFAMHENAVNQVGVVVICLPVGQQGGFPDAVFAYHQNLIVEALDA